MYIIDTNILVEANRVHFPLNTAPDFWNWLVMLGQQGKICFPELVYKEIGRGNDDLIDWLEIHKKIFFRESVEAYVAMPHVMQAYIDIFGKTSAIPETLLDTLGADPYIVAHAIVHSGIAVSNERQNYKMLKNYKEIKISHVCRILNIPCLTLVQFIWKLRQELPL